MGVVETKLDQVVRQRLHLLVYPKAMPEYLLVLLSLLVVQRVESIRDPVLLTQCLLASLHWEGPPRGNPHDQQRVIGLFPGQNIIDLSHGEDHAVLARVVELEPLLADPFDAIGPYQFVGFDVDLANAEALVFSFELVAEVGIDDRVDLLQFYGGVPEVELQFVLNSVPLCVLGIDLLVFLEVIFLQT